ncbi:serine hydrolase [Dyella sp.]|uniref:serine hydrolase n=1 Tax=Dyella sp. TaxID=1869338 RepID=UPI00284AE5A8|nr:serine hydrolase [Dyella sp.]MDR3447942.1 serine hydrolase [Dyella sp.]
MSGAMKTLALGLSTLALSLSAHGQGQPVAKDTQARITAIESCLPDAVVIHGEKHPCETLSHRMQAWRIPGVSVVVIHHGAIEWAKGYGVASVGGDAVTAQTLFQAGSISKPVAAMAALRLVQQGRLSLDTDINSTLQRWKVPASPLAPGAVVTLRELLNHTSGLSVHGFPGYAAGKPVPSLVQVLNGEPPANTAAVQLESMPGSRWNYSGGGYTVMQLLMEDVTHQAFAQLLYDTVIAPLGMRHSTYEQPLPVSMRVDVATPYDADGQPIPGGAHTYPEMAAAGLWSTPSDLALYVLELQRSIKDGVGHVLDKSTTEQMLTAGKGKWGLGIGIGGSAGHPYFQHFGVNEGFEGVLFGYRDSGEGAVIMTNAAGGAELARDLLRSIAVAYAWPDYQPVKRIAITLDRPVLERYVGTYQVAPDLGIRITLEGGQLMSQLTDQRKLPMFPASRSRFFTRTNMEFEFVTDSRGRIEEVVLHQNNQNLNGRKR